MCKPYNEHNNIIFYILFFNPVLSNEITLRKKKTFTKMLIVDVRMMSFSKNNCLNIKQGQNGFSPARHDGSGRLLSQYKHIMQRNHNKLKVFKPFSLQKKLYAHFPLN